MKSSVTRSFRKQLARLPAEVQQQAAQAYALWRADASHPGLQFKRVSQRQEFYSARVGIVVDDPEHGRLLLLEIIPRPHLLAEMN